MIIICDYSEKEYLSYGQSMSAMQMAEYVVVIGPESYAIAKDRHNGLMHQEMPNDFLMQDITSRIAEKLRIKMIYQLMISFY